MSKYILPSGDYFEIGYYKNDQVFHHINKKGETFNFQYRRQTNTIEYTYDNKNNIIKELQNNKTIEKTYDKNSNPLTVSVDTALIQTNSYNSINKLSTITNRAEFTYDKDGIINTVTYNNGISNTITINNKQEEIKREYTLNGISLFSQENLYDENSNLIEETIYHQNQTLIKEYGYDKQDRLIQDIYRNHGVVT